MKSRIAIQILLGLLCIVVLFHIGILVKLIPYQIAWGGRLQDDAAMYVFESVSIGVNLLLIVVLTMKGGFIKSYLSAKVIDIILWFFFTLFILNTIGNLFAKTDFEKMFSILTLGFALLIWTILRGKKLNSTSER